MVAAVLAGDREAFGILVEREADDLVRACHRILGDLHEAEDVAQEAFVTAFRALGSWRAEGAFGAWLTRIGVRLALRRVSRRRPVAWIDVGSPERPERPAAGRVSEDDAGAATPLGTVFAADPALSALTAERRAAVRRAVAGLDEPYREVVALRFFGELSLQEIAAQSGRPLGTVKTHLHRGLIRLRRSLEREGFER